MTRRYGRHGRKMTGGRTYASPPDGRAALLRLLDQLQASYLIYREGHWTVEGKGYYGNHLLLERVYSETEKEIDDLAEMIVGSFGSGLIRSRDDSSSRWAEDFRNPVDPMRGALKAARVVRASIDDSYNSLKGSGEMTTGWDDLLMSLAQGKDKHLYLLQQATAE